MRTTGLDPRIPDHEPMPVERSEESAIESEIAVRFIELAEHTSQSRAATFLSKLYALHSAEPTAFWFVCRILSGDLTEVTKSFTEMGKDPSRSMSKQAEQQSSERVLEILTRLYPNAAHVIIELRGITAKIDP